jgi:hypothetical protein
VPIYPNPTDLISKLPNNQSVNIKTIEAYAAVMPDTSLEPFVNAPASLALGTIPAPLSAVRDAPVDEEVIIDPDAKLILSDFTQGTPLRDLLLMQVTEYFPMDLYRSMFFINTLDAEYSGSLILLFLTLQKRWTPSINLPADYTINRFCRKKLPKSNLTCRRISTLCWQTEMRPLQKPLACMKQ